jgi:LysM repeat protein
VSHDDDSLGECFRVYKDAEDSYRDHSNFLRGNDRYAFLFKLDPTDYKGWAYGLRKAGYATNPRYADILIKHIETYNLEQYTAVAIGEMPVFDGSKFTSDAEMKTPDDAGNSAHYANLPETGPAQLSVNNCKAIFAPKGTSLLAIATNNNINLSRLLELNELKKDGLLEKDQFIFLEKKRTVGNMDFCVVEPGETLYDVAQKNGIFLQNLCDYNHLSANDNMVAGTKLFLRPSSQVSLNQYDQGPQPVASQTALTKENVRIQTHEVLPKEGLYSISKRYGVTVSQIKEWNNLRDDNLRVGQLLIISK